VSILSDFMSVKSVERFGYRRKTILPSSGGINRGKDVMREFEVFGDLSFASLRRLYRSMKMKKKMTED